MLLHYYTCTTSTILCNVLCYHGAVALFLHHSVALLNQDVCKALVSRLRADEQLHAHDALQDGVQRDDERLALHQRDEALASSAAPRVAQDDGLGRGTDSDDLKLPSLTKRPGYCVILNCIKLYVPAKGTTFQPGRAQTERQTEAPWGCCRQRQLCCQSPGKTPARTMEYKKNLW